MDTSEKYIEMCRQAKEIQDSWKPTDGDVVETYTIFWDDVDKTTMKRRLKSEGIGIIGIIHLNKDARKKEQVVFLPRQDQLQELLKDLYVDGCPRKLILKMWNWIAETAPKPDGSHEQLWLLFAMKEKFKKRWNQDKNEWVAINV